MILDICGTAEVLKVFRLVRIVVMIIKIVVPILLILSLMIDYAKAITKNDSDLLAKTNSVAVKKAIAVFLIFMIPTAVDIIASASDFDTNNYLSCFANANNETILEIEVNTAEKYLSDLSADYSKSQYMIVKLYIEKINDDGTRRDLLDRLEAIKDANSD